MPSTQDEQNPRHRTLRPLLIAAGIIALLNSAGIFALWRYSKSRSVPPTVSLAEKRETAADADPRFPARDPKARRNEVDLSGYLNFPLNHNWHDVAGNDLAELPTGLQTFAGTEFDVRGLIQVAQRSQVHPPMVTDIPIGQICRRIHFLHSAIGAGKTAKETVIGRYILHYADGELKEIPIIVGVNVADWWEATVEDDAPLVIAWSGENTKSRSKGKRIRLFKYSWENPRPAVPVKTIDFLAEFPGPSPFLVALTVD